MSEKGAHIVWERGTRHVTQVVTERGRMKASAAAIRRVLKSDGKLAQVEAIALTDPDAAIEWEYSATYSRLSSFVVSLGEANGFTSEYIDSLFLRAMELDE